jgi:ribonuclease VapC
VKPPMTEVVLDASALLAMFNGEPGGDRVAEGIAQAWVSAVNAAEVISKLVWLGWSPEAAVEAVGDLDCEVAPADELAAVRAGLLHGRLGGKGISLGDSFCISLAEANGLPVLTADRAWASLGLGVEVTLIR